MTLMGFVFIFVGTCGSLTALMGVRFLSSWKIMPAGLMAGARQEYFILAIGYLYIIYDFFFIPGFLFQKTSQMSIMFTYMKKIKYLYVI